MWFHIVREVEQGPRAKIEYNFRYDIDRGELLLDRCYLWTRRAKTSHTWTGEMIDIVCPPEVFAEIEREARERVESLMASFVSPP